MSGPVLAMTEMAAYAWYAMVALYIAVALYIPLGGWRRGAAAEKLRLLWFLLLPPALFITLWFCGRWVWTILWWFQLGDDGPYEQYGSRTSGILAAIMSVILFARMAAGRVSHRYLRITISVTAVLGVLLGGVIVHEFVHRIYGWSARGAAESHFSRLRVENHPLIDTTEPRRIVEEENLSEPGLTKRFVLYYGEAPVGEVRVAPYGWYWWTHSSSRGLHLDWAERKYRSDPEAVTERLESFIRNNPTSAEARLAKMLLKRLQRTADRDSP